MLVISWCGSHLKFDNGNALLLPHTLSFQLPSDILIYLQACRKLTLCVYSSTLCFLRHFSFELSCLYSLVAQMLPAMRKIQVRSLGQQDPLEKEMATHSSILAWKILWMKEPGKSMGSQRVGHDWATNTFCLYSLLCSIYYIKLNNPLWFLIRPLRKCLIIVYFFQTFLYLAALGLCCSMRDICCVVWHLLLQAGTLVVIRRLCGMGFVVLWYVGS